MKEIKNEKKINKKILAWLATAIIAVPAVFAMAPPSGWFAPWDTLDPDCAPWATDCFVKDAWYTTAAGSAVDMANNVINNLASPVAWTDWANKDYVDAAVAAAWGGEYSGCSVDRGPTGISTRLVCLTWNTTYTHNTIYNNNYPYNIIWSECLKNVMWKVAEWTLQNDWSYSTPSWFSGEVSVFQFDIGLSEVDCLALNN